MAARASVVLTELRGPEVKEKDALIAKLSPEVEKPGNVANGKALFTQNCAVCHKLNGEGKDAGPELTGMGAHGAAELLVSVLDPNREVDPSFVAVDLETKDGETYSGIVVNENRNSITLRNNAGENIIKVADLKAGGRRNTGRSLMPEGFEALGAENLRDILTFVCGADAKYRIIDLRPAFTADSSKGIYVSQEATSQSLEFSKFGLVKVGEIPFEIISPSKNAGGKNVVVLKGGNGFARTLPQKVEVNNLSLKASRLHFLGGVGGWAFPFGGNENLPVAKIAVTHADGQTEEFVLKNGVEVADYNGSQDVPGSVAAPGLLLHGQVRTFSRALQGRAPVQKIAIESYNNAVAPTFVAITAEIGEPSAQSGEVKNIASEKPAAEPFAWGPGIHVLLVGGGSSHDFNKWFNLADRAIVTASGKASANYTDKMGRVAEGLKNADVLGWSSNQPIDDAAARRAIFDFVEAGKGLLLMHPGLWYNWKDWPEYNRVLAGGGARSHDKYGEFEITVTQPNHPIMKGVPSKFTISDELYHSEIDPQGTAIEVLATAYEVKSGKTFPSIWIVKHPKARIVCIAPGHDGKAHELPAYQTILQNSVTWAAGK